MMPILSIKKKINDKIDDLLSKELINDFEASNLKQGSKTLHFYGLPKIHKEHITFPPLRPICSGFNSCTAKISEFIDAYLNPIQAGGGTMCPPLQVFFLLC